VRLSFSVLWFDDSEDYFDSLDLEPLQQEVFSWGFSPDIKMVTTPTEFHGYTPFKAFDLIVVDRNLEEYEDGQEFIAELRDSAIYTEVIFYTAGNVSDLWAAVLEKQLEGVFVSHRNDILSKISKVGYQTIRKVLDLENMRGIVMAEVGELDHSLDEIIKLGMVGLSEEQQKSIFKRFHAGATKQNQDFGKCLVAFSENPDINAMIDMCDSNKRWQNFIRLRRYLEVMRKDEVGDYEAEVLIPRNALAHGKPEIFEEGFRFHYRGREFLFNDEVSYELRKTILTYKNAFTGILEALQNG
jgi:hypothetical protein